VLFVHNHPSGDPSPSREDLEITRRLKEAGELMGVRVLDHIIIGSEGYVSLADRGLL
jgi:DNA repair protein RadC